MKKAIKRGIVITIALMCGTLTGCSSCNRMKKSFSSDMGGGLERKGLVVKATTVHHRKYLRQYPELALDPDNLEPICERCHYDEHHRKKPGFTNQERW